MATAAEASAQIIQEKAGAAPIEYVFVLGTGLGSAMEALEDAVTIPYADLPGFPGGNVPGHDGKLIIGSQEGLRVAYMLGRAHYYEAGDPRAMATPLEALARCGVQKVVLTNAAGSVKADLYPRSLVLVTDHINLNGPNPLVGSPGESGFVSMQDAYDPRMLRRMKRAAVGAGVSVHEGVYMWFSGPSFETPAEIKMARSLGADIVGMSTVPETILARRLGLRVAALSIITNFGAGFQSGNPTHTETREIAMQGAISLRRLLRAFTKTKDDAWAAGR
jgi:purine-nucleoside phosphorylase